MILLSEENNSSIHTDQKRIQSSTQVWSTGGPKSVFEKSACKKQMVECKLWDYLHIGSLVGDQDPRTLSRSS